LPNALPARPKNWQSHPDYPDRNKNRSSGHGSRYGSSGRRRQENRANRESLQEIIRMNDRVRDMINQIATTTAEQSATSSEVSANIGEIARLAAESSNGALESAKACDELSAMAIDLEKSSASSPSEMPTRAVCNYQLRTRRCRNLRKGRWKKL